MDAPRTLEEVLGLSQISSDLRPREQTSAIDRVTALGFAPALGSLLIRLKVGNDHRCYTEAVELVATRLHTIGRRKNWGHMGRMRRVAAEAIRYHLLGICQTCGGRGQLAHSYDGKAEEKAGQLCPTCQGSCTAPRDAPGRARAIFQPGDIPSRLEEILDTADDVVDRSVRSSTRKSKIRLYGWWSLEKNLGPSL